MVMFRIAALLIVSMGILCAGVSEIQVKIPKPQKLLGKSVSKKNFDRKNLHVSVQTIGPLVIRNTLPSSPYRFRVQWSKQFIYNDTRDDLRYFELFQVLKNKSGYGESAVTFIHRYFTGFVCYKDQFKYLIRQVDFKGNSIRYFQYTPKKIRHATSFCYHPLGIKLYTTGMGGKRFDVFYIENIPLTTKDEVRGEVIARKLLDRKKLGINKFCEASPAPIALFVERDKFTVIGVDHYKDSGDYDDEYYKERFYFWQVPMRKGDIKERWSVKRYNLSPFPSVAEPWSIEGYWVDPYQVVKSENEGFYFIDTIDKRNNWPSVGEVIKFDKLFLRMWSKSYTLEDFRPEVIRDDKEGYLYFASTRRSESQNHKYGYIYEYKFQKCNPDCSKTIWEKRMQSGVADFEVVGNKIIGITGDGEFFALDKRNGKLLWNTKLTESKRFAGWYGRNVWKKPGTRNEYFVVLLNGPSVMVIDLKVVKQ